MKRIARVVHKIERMKYVEKYINLKHAHSCGALFLAQFNSQRIKNSPLRHSFLKANILF